MKKKMVAVALTAAMTMAAAVSAQAGTATVESVTGDPTEIEVQAKFVDEGTQVTVYSVDVEWDNMTFTYTQKGDYTWNPEDHTYTNSSADQGGWDKEKADIKVTNHSNKPVNVTWTYTAENGASCYFKGGSITDTTTTTVTEKLEAGKENKPDEADQGIYSLYVKQDVGNLNQTGSTKLGKVTVTVAAVSEDLPK